MSCNVTNHAMHLIGLLYISCDFLVPDKSLDNVCDAMLEWLHKRHTPFIVSYTCLQGTRGCKCPLSPTVLEPSRPALQT